MSATIYCYGDSNTYGYDPRSFLGDRYPAQDRWPDLLSVSGNLQVICDGENGREIPTYSLQLSAFCSKLQQTKPDLLIVMLGSNDLLSHPSFSAEDVALRMREFLQALPPVCPILLVAPVPMKPGAWVSEERLLKESARIAAVYRALEQEGTVFFADTSAWDIPLAYDGVHFTAEGHHRFAHQLAACISQILQKA